MGTYVLALRLDAGRTIAIGSLGQYRFPAGWYLYVGSARGPGGLRARLERHRRRLGPDKKVHWHIDFLREYGTWAGAWVRRADEHLECAWARRLGGLPGVAVVVPGFGASDCRCAAHLFHLAALPDDGWFARALGAERIVLQNRRLEDLVAALLEGSDEHREQAAVALGNLGTAVLAPLAELLDSQDADARWWAARALAEVGGGEAARLLAGILADSNPDVRACACLALGRIGGRQAAIDLAACLADESPFVAGIAADALSMIGEPAVSVLAECLSTKNTHLRLLAVRALSRIRSEAAIPSLISMLEDSSYLVRHYAEEGLEALGLGLVLFSP
jgi:Uri superfamily endonuclease